jgi:hypothetical protein
VYEVTRVNIVVFEGYLSEKTKCFKHVSFVILSASTKFNGLGKGFTNVTSTCRPSTLLICNVIFYSGARIDFKFTRIDWTAKTTIILSSIDVIGVIFRIIDMFFRSVNSKSFLSYLLISSLSIRLILQTRPWHIQRT